MNEFSRYLFTDLSKLYKNYYKIMIQIYWKSIKPCGLGIKFGKNGWVLRPRIVMVCSLWWIHMSLNDNRSQHVMVDGYRNKLVNVVSGVPQGSVLGRLFFLLYTSELFSILQNMLIGYADDSTLLAVLPSQGVRVRVAESLIRDLGRVSEWCDLWGMKLNAGKTKTMTVSRSGTMHPKSTPIN